MMKNLRSCTLFLCILALICCALWVPALAENNEATPEMLVMKSGNNTGSTIANARDIVFGTNYAVSWSSDTDHLNCYNKLIVPADGILSISTTKPLDDYGKLGSLEFYLYDKSGNTAWGNETYRAKSDGSDGYSLHVGVAKGVYYLTLKPGFSVKTGTIVTQYTIDFTEDAFAEREHNESTSSATEMVPGHFYSAWYGHDGANNTETVDCFRFTATEGNSYALKLSDYAALKSSTTLFNLLTPDGNVSNISSQLKSNGVLNYQASSTGMHVLLIHNYSGKQLSYKVGVFVTDGSNGTHFTVLYNANGGSSTPEMQLKQAGTALTLSSAVPTRAGYTFIGWAHSPASEPEYQPGDSYTADSDITLYAIWEEETTSDTIVIGTTIGTTMSNAVNVRFGTGYKKQWTSSTDHLNCYNRIVMERPGILHISATKPEDSDEYGSLKFYLYNNAGDLLWGNGTHRAQDDNRTDYSLNVGLGKGTYYLTIKPGFSVNSGSITTTYQLSARYTSACELEPNETVASATAMELNRYYSGYIGRDGANNCESNDYFYFTATAGKYYTIRSYSYAQLYATTAIVDLLLPSGETDHITNDMGENIDSQGNNYWLFNAPTTGRYGIRIHNYSGSQVDYTIGVFAEETAEALIYTVRYDANGGTNAPNSQLKSYGSSLKLSSDIPVRTGYSFVGWADSISALTPDYMPGDDYSGNANLTLYAIWQSIGVGDSSVNLGTSGYSSVSSALSASFGTSYMRSWNSTTDSYTTYHKLIVNENGTLAINATKPYDSDEYGSLEFTLYDQSGSTVVWANNTYHAKEDPKDSYRLLVGIPAGTYYLAIKPHFSIISGTANSTYSFTFAASPYTELEPNDSADYATPLILDHMYTASYGKDGSSKGEKEDHFKFQVIQGTTYQIRSDNFDALSASTAIVKLTDPLGNEESIRNDMEQTADQNNHCCYSFTANASGTAYIRVYNYSNASINYSIGVFTSQAQLPTVVTITYDANGGTGGILRQLCYENTTCYITDQIPVREGSLFLGWGLSANAEEAVYQPGDLFTGTSDIKLYALWLNIVSDETPRIALPAGTVSVEAESFCGISAQYVIVPDGCTSIGSRAFANCSQLKAISLPTGIAIAEDAFEGSNCVLLYR